MPYYRLTHTNTGTLGICGSCFWGVYKYRLVTSPISILLIMSYYSSPLVVQTVRFSGFWFKPGFDIL